MKTFTRRPRGSSAASSQQPGPPPLSSSCGDLQTVQPSVASSVEAKARTAAAEAATPATATAAAVIKTRAGGHEAANKSPAKTSAPSQV